MNDDDVELLYKLAVLGVTLVALGIWIVKNNKSHELFRAFAAKHNLTVMEDKGWLLRPATPRLKGKINHREVDVIIQRKRGKWFGGNNFFTILRVHSRSTDNFRYSIELANFAIKILSSTITTDVQTGFGDFDSMYQLTSNDEPRALKLFNHHLCEDFVSNPEAFECSGLTYSSGLLEYKWDFMATEQGQVDRLGEIMHFMVHVVEQTEASKS